MGDLENKADAQANTLADSEVTPDTTEEVNNDSLLTQEADEAEEQEAPEQTDESGEEADGNEADEAEEQGGVEYSDFELPDGMEMNAEALDEFKGIAKELGIKQEDAQRFVGLGAKLVEAQAQKQAAEWQEKITEWRKEVESAKGSKELLVSATRAVKNFADDDVIEMLNTTGLGNHPAIVKMFAKIDKATGEDTFELGNEPEKELSLEERLFG